MIWVLGLAALILIVSIVLLTGSPQKSRTQQLAELEKFLEGKSEPMDDTLDGVRIRFTYKGLPYAFEEVPDPGFSGKAYKGFLKLMTTTNFTMTFTERERSSKVQSSLITMAERTSDVEQQKVRIDLPDALQMFNVFTNNPKIANQLLHDRKLLEVFLKYKHVDASAYPSMSLRILNGVITLEFHSMGSAKPKLSDVHTDKHVLDKYMNDLYTVAQQVKA